MNLMVSPADIHIKPIGYVERLSSEEDDRDRSLVSRIVIESEFAEGLEGIEEWSHIYVILWLNKISDKDKMLIHPGGGVNVGIFATRAPIHPNPIGLTLVKLIEHRGNALLVKGLDAFHGTPVLDIKPYPDWERGRLIVVTNFKIPTWVAKIVKQGAVKLAITKHITEKVPSHCFEEIRIGQSPSFLVCHG